MWRLSLSLSDSMARHVQEQAAREGITLDRFIARAMMERMASLGLEERRREQDERGGHPRYDA